MILVIKIVMVGFNRLLMVTHFQWHGKIRPLKNWNLGKMHLWMHTFEIDDVSKDYGPTRAVRSVSLSIYKGELFSLLGGSGCGKTTLLRLLAGFEKPTSGRIWIDGVDVTDWPPYQRPVNMMFQSYALFPHMTVYQNVAFGLKQEILNRAQIHERVMDGLALVQMADLAHRKPQQLSGGQRQRVALARSLVKRPKIIVIG